LDDVVKSFCFQLLVTEIPQSVLLLDTVHCSANFIPVLTGILLLLVKPSEEYDA